MLKEGWNTESHKDNGTHKDNLESTNTSWNLICLSLHLIQWHRCPAKEPGWPSPGESGGTAHTPGSGVGETKGRDPWSHAIRVIQYSSNTVPSTLHQHAEHNGCCFPSAIQVQYKCLSGITQLGFTQIRNF